MTLACVRRPTCEARSAAWKASPITYTPPWKYRTTWRGSIPSIVISAVGTPPSAAAVTVTSAGRGCVEASSGSSRRCSLTSLSNGKADCRRIASRFSRCSVLTEDLPSVGIRPAALAGGLAHVNPLLKISGPGGGHPRPRAAPRAAVGPGAFGSGVDRSADAEPGVEAQRLHDLERRGVGEDLDVRSGQHAGVLGDDGRGRAFGDSVQVGLHPGPGVLPVPHVKGDRVDCGQCLPRARLDVGDVLLVHRDVVAGGEPAEVPADEVGPRVVQRDGRGAHVPGDMLGQVDVVDGHPAGVDDVDEHQGVVAGEVDVDVVRGVVGAVPGQFGALRVGSLSRTSRRLVSSCPMRTTSPSNSEAAPAWSAWWWE